MWIQEGARRGSRHYHYCHLQRLSKAHLVAEEYPSVPSLDSGGHSLALEREQRVLKGRCAGHERYSAEQMRRVFFSSSFFFFFFFLSFFFSLFFFFLYI